MSQFSVRARVLALSCFALAFVAASPAAHAAPSAPGAPVLSDVAESTAKVCWTAATDPIGVSSYRIYFDDILRKKVAGNVTCTTVPVGATSEPQDVVIGAVGAAGEETRSTATAFRFEAPDPGLVFGYLLTDSQEETKATISWVALPSASTPIDRYEVFLGGQLVETRPPGQPTELQELVLTGLTPDTAYTVSVVAYSPGGEQVQRQETFRTPMAAPTVSDVRGTTAKVCASPAPGRAFASYRFYLDFQLVAETTEPCTQLTGLTVGVAYTASVIGTDVTGFMVASGPRPFVALPPVGPLEPVKYGYAVSGAAQLKNLTRGSVPLSGSVAAELELATGDFTADLSLQRSTANLVALGFLPVVAKVDVVPTVPVTGNLAGGVLTAATKVRIKLPQVTLFGLQLAGGSSCQTRSASAINLKSVGEFDALDGGTLAGTFAISDLTGCGALTGLVSPLTAGPGNTIALKLTEQG